MTAHDYLQQVLASQELTERELRAVRSLRDEFVRTLSPRLAQGTRIYYGGSYGKQTMIRESYDLDLVVYYPPDVTMPLREIFGHVHSVLVGMGLVVHPRTVALRIPAAEGFHVDVVPGRAHDTTFRYATLYRNTQPPGTLQTSLKVHIDAVRKSELRPLVRLLKLWRLRHAVPLTSFTLEIVAARALTGQRREDYATAMATILQFIAAEMDTVQLADPANTNNVLEVTAEDRSSAAQAATRSLSGTWKQLLW